MEKNGRVVIPGRIRKQYRTRKFFLEADEDRIQIIPIKSLESLFGTAHELHIPRIYRDHEEEKDEE